MQNDRIQHSTTSWMHFTTEPSNGTVQPSSAQTISVQSNGLIKQYFYTFCSRHQSPDSFWVAGVLLRNCNLFALILSILSQGSRGLMVESRTRNRKVVSLSLGPAGIVGGGSECRAFSPSSIPRRGALEQDTEPTTAPRTPEHHCSGCVFTAVCVHFKWVKCRAQVLYVMSRHITTLAVNYFL